MSTNFSIKRHNHRIHPCVAARKQELLQKLLLIHKDESILVISQTNTTTTEVEDQNLTLSNDAELAKMDERLWNVVISYEVPTDAQAYAARLSHAKTLAVILVDAKEQQLLYPIETLLGRTIVPEIIEGFEPKVEEPRWDQPKSNVYKSAGRSENKKPWEKDTRQGDNKPYEKRSFDKKPWEKSSNDRGGDKKPWDKGSSDKKSYDKKPWDKKHNDRNDSDRKPWDKKEQPKSAVKSTPKRPPRIIVIPANKKQAKESE
ncbi:MAG: hypothetical protein OEW60_06660 [Thiovulaceae bacterium]|nr:hypothetical protein [Sulfurimonadaceae bacterium]